MSQTGMPVAIAPLKRFKNGITLKDSEAYFLVDSVVGVKNALLDSVLEVKNTMNRNTATNPVSTRHLPLQGQYRPLCSRCSAR